MLKLSAQVTKREGGMPQFCILFYANYTILATQKGRYPFCSMLRRPKRDASQYPWNGNPDQLKSAIEIFTLLFDISPLKRRMKNKLEILSHRHYDRFGNQISTCILLIPNAMLHQPKVIRRRTGLELT